MKFYVYRDSCILILYAAGIKYNRMICSKNNSLNFTSDRIRIKFSIRDWKQIFDPIFKSLVEPETIATKPKINPVIHLLTEW